MSYLKIHNTIYTAQSLTLTLLEALLYTHYLTGHTPGAQVGGSGNPPWDPTEVSNRDLHTMGGIHAVAFCVQSKCPSSTVPKLMLGNYHSDAHLQSYFFSETFRLTHP